MNFIVNYPGVATAFVLILFCASRWFIVSSDRRRTEFLLVVAALSIPLAAAAEAVANSLSRIRPLKFDEFVFQIDRVFGEPSFALGRLAARHAWFHDLISITYGILPMMMVAVFAAYLWLRSEAEAFTAIKVLAVNLLAALPLYLLFPVCGPAFAFAHYPYFGLRGAPHMLAIAAAPNGVPSVHTSSALLIFWLLRPWRVGRILGVGFLALTVLATLGSGQHYFFDLICAVPYACAVYACSVHKAIRHGGRIRNDDLERLAPGGTQ